MLANCQRQYPEGQFDGPAQAYDHQRQRPDHQRRQYANVIIAYRNGSRCGCRTSRTSSATPENNKLAAWVNPTPAIILNVQRQPGANVIEVVDRIKALLPRCARRCRRPSMSAC